MRYGTAAGAGLPCATFAALLLAALPSPAGAQALPAPASASGPASADQLAHDIGDAMNARDLPALEGLVNWDGASPMKHRFFDFEMRRYFGDRVKSATAEALPQETSDTLQHLDGLKTNMPVTMRIRIDFIPDKDNPDDLAPMYFLIGQDHNVYKIALVNVMHGNPHH